MIKVLFTGGGGAGNEALWRLFGHRYALHFGDADPAAIDPSIPEDRRHQLPWAYDPDFVGKTGELCQFLGIDLLVPGVDEELLPLARGARSWGFDTMLPPEDFVAIHLDKLASNRFLWRNGLPAPRTEPCDGQQRVGFPCIAKPRSGRGSRNVAVVNSEQELQAHILLARGHAEDFITQELMVGQEYTVMMMADRAGLLRAVVPVLVEQKRGITLRAHTVKDEQVILACAAIHAANPVSGYYNIQLIKTTAGEVMPFELNPRISTTACLGLAAGVDFIGVFLGNSGLVGSGTSSLLDFQGHVGLMRSWHNEFSYG